MLLSRNMHETHVQLGYKVCDVVCKSAPPVTAVPNGHCSNEPSMKISVYLPGIRIFKQILIKLIKLERNCVYACSRGQLGIHAEITVH